MIGYIFPGQGSQKQGMGLEEHKGIFDIGTKATGRDIGKLCFDTPDEILQRTENAQLAIFAVSMALLKDEKPSVAAGFSLGECSALCAAGCFSLEDGFRLVDKRAKVMQKAADNSDGTMTAIIGLDAEKIIELSKQTKATAVNFNYPTQTVIAGKTDEVAKLAELCHNAGAKKIKPLGVSGAFHTTLMKDAAEELFEFVAKEISTNTLNMPVYTNITGEPLSEKLDLATHLATQMQSPVQWVKTVQNMRRDGVGEFEEIGCGISLTKFVKKICI